MNIIHHYFKHCYTFYDFSNHLLWISAVTALQKVVEAIPNFLSQYLLDILTIVTNQSSKVMLASEAYKGYKAQLPARLKSLRYTM